MQLNEVRRAKLPVAHCWIALGKCKCTEEQNVEVSLSSGDFSFRVYPILPNWSELGLTKLTLLFAHPGDRQGI